LVVEDNSEMIQFIAGALAADYRVATAADGAEGLRLAQALQPDLIVSDVMMPGLSGDELVAAVRKFPELDAVPIILLTARADDELRVRLLTGGAQDYLIKPFSPVELRARANNLVALKRARDVLQREVESQSLDLAALANQLAERTRQVRRALEARDDFLSSAAHDLKTPVAAALLPAQVLEGGAPRAPAAPADLPRLQALVGELRRLKDLVHELLDASRAEQGRLVGRLEPLDVGALAEQVCRRRIPDERHRYSVEAEPAVVGQYDGARLRQLLDNLIDNAVKYSPDGGIIQIKVWQCDGEAWLAVTDPGIGIPAEELTMIFERFHRAGNVDDRRFVGMGLGLFICRAIAEQHGGRIWASSAGPGRGSTFHVALPLASPVHAAIPE
jgi:signal transduction histidine kinase